MRGSFAPTQLSRAHPLPWPSHPPLSCSNPPLSLAFPLYLAQLSCPHYYIQLVILACIRHIFQLSSLYCIQPGCALLCYYYIHYISYLTTSINHYILYYSILYIYYYYYHYNLYLFPAPPSPLSFSQHIVLVHVFDTIFRTHYIL